MVGLIKKLAFWILEYEVDVIRHQHIDKIAKQMTMIDEDRRQLAAHRELLREESAQTREDFLKAISSIAEHFSLGQRAQAEQVGKLADASAAQAAAFQSHLALFSVTSPPTSRTLRDADEYQSEIERAGFPALAPYEDQLKWVLSNT